MARKVFFSFHYQRDCWRVNQVRNIWVCKKREEELPFYDRAEFEKVKRQGTASIERWIDNQMQGSSITIVLIGAETANRPFVNYEIKQSHILNKKMIGIYIDNIKNSNGYTDIKGKNPFNTFTITYDNGNKKLLSEIYKTYSPSSYQEIYDNIGTWIDNEFK